MKKDLRLFTALEDSFIQLNHSWIYPQAISIIAELPLTKDLTKAKYCGNLTLAHWKTLDLNPSYWLALDILTSSPRGNYVKTSQKLVTYNQTVPLVLSAFKQYRGIAYEKWINPILEPVHQTMMANRTTLPDPRTFADLHPVLLYKTGKQAGKVRNPTSWISSWRGFGCPTFQDLDIYSKHCVTHTWLWHKSIIQDLSIQSFYNWDLQSSTPDLFL
jgi:hypothetical protein